jgi:hypothetical protein
MVSTSLMFEALLDVREMLSLVWEQEFVVE